eukprot:tig00000681_g3123.t1
MLLSMLPPELITKIILAPGADARRVLALFRSTCRLARRLGEDVFPMLDPGAPLAVCISGPRGHHGLEDRIGNLELANVDAERTRLIQERPSDAKACAKRGIFFYSDREDPYRLADLVKVKRGANVFVDTIAEAARLIVGEDGSGGPGSEYFATATRLRLILATNEALDDANTAILAFRGRFKEITFELVNFILDYRRPPFVRVPDKGAVNGLAPWMQEHLFAPYPPDESLLGCWPERIRIADSTWLPQRAPCAIREPGGGFTGLAFLDEFTMPPPGVKELGCILALVPETSGAAIASKLHCTAEDPLVVEGLGVNMNFPHVPFFADYGGVIKPLADLAAGRLRARRALLELSGWEPDTPFVESVIPPADLADAILKLLVKTGGEVRVFFSAYTATGDYPGRWGRALGRFVPLVRRPRCGYIIGHYFFSVLAAIVRGYGGGGLRIVLEGLDIGELEWHMKNTGLVEALAARPPREILLLNCPDDDDAAAGGGGPGAAGS